MTRPAVPAYLDTVLAGDLPPGHRFGLYFAGWQDDWQLPKEGKAEELGKLAALGATATAQLGALRARQAALASQTGDTVLRVSAVSTAPFTTGLGIEHPRENGFAFLDPYGLPYLPGSGVKGVLRRAAEELALAEGAAAQGWDIVALWWLFGFEPASTYLTGPDGNTPKGLEEVAEAWRTAYLRAVERLPADHGPLRTLFELAMPEHERRDLGDDPRRWLRLLAADRTLRERVRTRGALSFWDVLPKPAGERLAVDILNPHHKGYYEGKVGPHDAESPEPAFFLTVPPDSRFDFHVRCEPARLPEPLRERWRELARAAFVHAFDWLGFGAKTAVGYGALRDAAAPAAAATPAVSGGATLSAETERWENAALEWQPGSQTLIARRGSESARLKGEPAKALLEALSKNQRSRLGRGLVLTVAVRRIGNRCELEGLELPAG